jgi:hypothetical protein
MDGGPTSPFSFKELQALVSGDVNEKGHSLLWQGDDLFHEFPGRAFTSGKEFINQLLAGFILHQVSLLSRVKS